jgi:hypothetical protein
VTSGDSSPAIQDNDGNIAFVGAGNSAQTGDDSVVNQSSGGMANRQTGDANAAVNGSGQANIQNGTINNNASAVTGANSPVQQRNTTVAAGGVLGMDSSSVQSITNNTTPVAANQGSGMANSGNMGVGTVNGDTNVQVPVQIGASPLQTVAMTQLKQVNAGVSVANGNSFSGGTTLTANSTNSSSTGVMATSANIGIASNSAAQNIVNVTANVNRP